MTTKGVNLTKADLAQVLKDFEDEKKSRQEHVNIEFWGRSIPEGEHRFSLDDGKISMSSQTQVQNYEIS